MTWRRSASCDERDGTWAWKARRPSLPPLFFLAAVLWAALALSIDALFGSSRGTCEAVAAAGVAGIAIGCAMLVRGRAVVACLVVGVALGCVLAATHAIVLSGQMAANKDAPSTQVVQLVRDARRGAYGSSALARGEDGALIRLVFPEESRLLVGDRLRITGRAHAASAKYAGENWRDGVSATVTVHSFELLEQPPPFCWLRGIRAEAIGRMERSSRDAGDAMGIDCGQSMLFMRAVLLGYTDGLYASALYQAVRVDGLAHLVAVSGAHLVIVCGLAVALMRRMAFARRWMIAGQVLLIACYLTLTGAPVSAIRAAVMASLASLSFFSGRRPYALGGLSACIVVMLAANPTAAFSMSLLLSAGSTFGIIMFTPLFGAWMGGPPRQGAPVALEPLALTLAASLVTMPVSACLFGQVSVIAPLANLVAAPVFTFVCAVGYAAMALSAMVPVVGPVLLGLLMIVVEAFCRLLDLLSRIPFAAVPAYIPPPAAVLAAVGVPAALWLSWPRPGPSGYGAIAVAVCLACTAALVSPLLRPDEIVMLDVGQGDAFLLTSGPHAMLIDTGTEDVSLLQGLGAAGARHLDAVLVTHPDDDHCGSLAALRGVVGVDRILVARDLLTCDDENCEKLREAAGMLVPCESLVGLSAGDRIRCGNFELIVVGPTAFKDGGGNADSVVVLMRSDDDGDGTMDHTALFCGDAEREQLHAYERAGLLEPVEILKVGHHGSGEAVDDELVAFLQPRVSLVSVGAYNRYGHPVAETLETLESGGSVVFRTDELGSVTCRLLPDRLQVVGER